MGTNIAAKVFRCTGARSLAVQLYPECGIVDIHLDRDHLFCKDNLPETCVIETLGTFDISKRAFTQCTLLAPKQLEKNTIPGAGGRKTRMRWLQFALK
jgi:hypothetical protein